MPRSAPTPPFSRRPSAPVARRLWGSCENGLLPRHQLEESPALGHVVPRYHAWTQQPGTTGITGTTDYDEDGRTRG
ncbi:hypothetical protein GCM10017667_24650 [Streptomyces filamentosus]|uniref:Uncharacterized protein n=1 Tax=Streptomyces filamentosus TaxID=67294 RepID=A0A919ELC4_STRFL|nr:hypothetical protein GCM10017667_24650 [Streptomyces filamentosus]